MNKKQKDLVDTLRHYSQSYYSNKYGIYLNDGRGNFKLVLLGNSNVYKTPGIAIRRICEETRSSKEDVQELIDQGVIKIDKIS